MQYHLKLSYIGAFLWLFAKDITFLAFIHRKSRGKGKSYRCNITIRHLNFYLFSSYYRRIIRKTNVIRRKICTFATANSRRATLKEVGAAARREYYILRMRLLDALFLVVRT